MLWIFTVIFVIVFIIGLYNGYEVAIGVGGAYGTVFLIITLVILAFYNSTKTSAKNEIVVLEEYNKELIAQIEPVVNKYLDHESTVLLGLKPEANTLIALSAYPELKGNEFIQQQIKVIVSNNKQIKYRKMGLASINSYKLWLFCGE